MSDDGRLHDRALGISIRFIRYWQPEPLPTLEDFLWIQRIGELLRWRGLLTADDRDWLRELQISPD